MTYNSPNIFRVNRAEKVIATANNHGKSGACSEASTHEASGGAYEVDE
jgi:hypothetical protein